MNLDGWKVEFRTDGLASSRYHLIHTASQTVITGPRTRSSDIGMRPGWVCFVCVHPHLLPTLPSRGIVEKAIPEAKIVDGVYLFIPEREFAVIKLAAS